MALGLAAALGASASALGLTDILGIGALGLGGLSWLTNTASQHKTTSQNNSIAGLNYRMQLQNLDWQKHVQNETWSREDTAVQRRMADLQAAGLNPNLAAGSSASSGSVVSTSAPQMQNKQAITLGNELDSINALLQIQNQKYSTELLKKQNSIANYQIMDAKQSAYQNMLKSDYETAKYTYDFNGGDYPVLQGHNGYDYDTWTNSPYLQRMIYNQESEKNSADIIKSQADLKDLDEKYYLLNQLLNIIGVGGNTYRNIKPNSNKGGK